MNEEQKIVDLWRNQPLVGSEIDMDMVIKSATTFQRQVRARNLLEYLAAGALVAWSGSSLLRSEVPLVVRVGVGLIGLGAMLVAIVLRLRGAAAHGGPPLAAPTREVVSWHRAELVRQRDLLRRVPLWYLGPLVPGVVVLLVGAWLSSPDQHLRVGLTAVLVGVVFAGFAALNARGASKLDQQITELGHGLDS